MGSEKLIFDFPDFLWQPPKLEFKEKENQGIADSLREHIASLWNRLLFPKEEVEEYLASHSAHKPSDLKVVS